MIFDTSFLIDLQREAHRDAEGGATFFLERNPDAVLQVSVITLGEVLEGYPRERDREAEELFSRFQVIAVDRAIASRYGTVSRSLRATGARVGDNDLWIAATAMELDENLVTRDREHFHRISGLKVLSY